MKEFIGVMLLLGVIGFTIWGIFQLAMADIKQKEQFMISCKQDHKEYECTAMWRAGENRTTVMPVPVYVGR